MKTTLMLLAGAAALFSTQALADPAPAARSSCLRAGEVDSWKTLDQRTLIVEDDFNHKFKMTLMGVCPQLRYRETIAIHSFGGTRLSCVAPGDSLIVRDVGPQRCPIRSVVAYTPEMEKADKEAAAAEQKSD